jgi:hypothetical protein
LKEAKFGGELDGYFANINTKIKYLKSELEALEFFSDEVTPRIVKQAHAEHFDKNDSIETCEDHINSIATNFKKIKYYMAKPYNDYIDRYRSTSSK